MEDSLIKYNAKLEKKKKNLMMESRSGGKKTRSLFAANWGAEHDSMHAYDETC